MINFEYYNPAKIIFGKGVENGVGREVAKYGKRVLLHYGGRVDQAQRPGTTGS